MLRYIYIKPDVAFTCELGKGSDPFSKLLPEIYLSKGNFEFSAVIFTEFENLFNE